MNDQKLKPVWRMNTGNRVPVSFQDCSEVILTKDKNSVCRLSNMVKRTDPQGNAYLEVGQYWSEKAYAYQTTRTKAAKYERVMCKSCVGTGSNIFCDCSKCNGTGTVRRKINGN